MANYPPMPHLGEPLSPPPISTTSPDARVSFPNTDFDSTLPLLRTRFPNIDPLYLRKIFRGTITPEGLIWLDVDREDASPPDFNSLAHMIYCFEVYGQIICIFADPEGGKLELELQRALADYRVRVLKLSKVATFESLREWHKSVVQAQINRGQDRVGGWRERREELGGLLRRA